MAGDVGRLCVIMAVSKNGNRKQDTIQKYVKNEESPYR